MNTLKTFPPFEQFFTELTGHRPYLWQIDAAHRLGDDTPAVIDIGTGMGKTSVIHAWLWAFARDQARCAADPDRRRTVQTRFHLIVDRRILVDSAADTAEKLAAALRAPRPDQPAVRAVAAAIAPLAASDGTLLSVRRLRGGTAGTPEHVRDPKIPAVITSTVDLAGSRLLFRGYGLSPGRRPIDAALVGADSLLVLDEAHLAAQFCHLLADLDAQALACETWFDSTLPPRSTIVMTATHAGGHPGPVLRADLTAERTASPHLDTRLTNRDNIGLDRLTADGSATISTAALASAVAANAPGRGEAVIVFVNTVRVARDLTTRLTKALPGQTDVVTVIGGTPEPIRQDVMARIGPYLTGSDTRQDAPGLVVVSTQSLEVGADVDFDRGYSELSTMASLVQRLGRINRVGARAHGRMTVFAGPSAGKDDAIYPPALRAGVQAVITQCHTLGDLTAAREHLDPDTVDLPVPADTLVGLGRGELGELLDTRNDVTAADVSTWIRPAARDWTIDIVFRAGADDLARIATPDPAALALYFDAAPLLRGERWTIPVTALSDLLGSAPPGTEHAVVIDAAARPSTTHLSQTKELLATVRAGWALVLEAHTGWSTTWIDGFGTDIRDRVPTRGHQPSRVALAAIEPDIDAMDPADTDAIAEDYGFSIDHYAVTVLADRLIMLTATPPVDVTEPKRRTTTADHNRDVGQRASAWALALRLPPTIVAAIETAGYRHDLGKCDHGFQYLLHLSATRSNAASPTYIDDGLLLAKSDLPDRLSHQALWMARRNGGLRNGFRHEARSVVESARQGYPHDVDSITIDLIEYLIATHHGHFRGLGPVMDDPGEHDTLQNPHHPAWAQWPDLVERLTTHYGPYTLALAETVLRLSDWECSALPTDIQEDPA